MAVIPDADAAIETLLDHLLSTVDRQPASMSQPERLSAYMVYHAMVLHSLTRTVHGQHT